MSINHSLGSSFLFIIFFFTSGCMFLDTQANSGYRQIETFTLTSIPITAIPQTLVPPNLPSLTPFPRPSVTATVTPTPVWVFQSGTISCPILLYHRIEDPTLINSTSKRYYTSPLDFEWQMQALKDWGYTTVPITLLVEAITKGANMPPRSIVISFDDGDETVYEHAYPIMQAQQFSGVMYLVLNYIGSQGYMDIDQIRSMTDHGWEIGSHSMTHPHLPAVHDQIQFEAGQSKARLESEIGVRLQTFAYPYGEIDPFIVQKISEYGYLAGVGLGTNFVHSLDSLYYLSRIEIRNGISRSEFASLLPWSRRP